VIYLLDVNALLALAYPSHVHNGRVDRWLHDVRARTAEPTRLATCAITELGFVRVASGAAAFASNVRVARADLRDLKASRTFTFLGDELDADHLPDWVITSKQTTDGHFLELAAAYRAQLATLDTRIPGAMLIPEHPDEPPMVRETQVPYRTAA
jgi:predicted nucleic acid-binding protein